MVTKIKNSHGGWTFVVPVYGLKLTSDVGNEFRVNQVTFISKKKLFGLRKRFGIYEKLKELSKSEREIHFYKWTETLAVIQRNGKASELESTVLKMIREELDILALSQLGYDKRTSNAAPSVDGMQVEEHNIFSVNTTSGTAYSGFKTTGKWQDSVLDSSWKKWQKDFYFEKLIKIIQGQYSVQGEWRKTLIRVVRLAGRSQTTTWLPNAFLLNMIAIETLLTRQGDKYTDELPKRIEAFIGWVSYWTVDDYQSNIESVYKKRCQYVHDGNDANIEPRDLLFTDDILFNLLYNLVVHYKIYSSKVQVIEFSEKIAAEKVLGIVGTKSKVRPKTLHFISKKYTEKDYEKI